MHPFIMYMEPWMVDASLVATPTAGGGHGPRTTSEGICNLKNLTGTIAVYRTSYNLPITT